MRRRIYGTAASRLANSSVTSGNELAVAMLSLFVGPISESRPGEALSSHPAP